MTDLGIENKEPPKSQETILKDTAARFKQLNEEARNILYGGNLTGYREKLCERARLIVELPEKIQNAPPLGHLLPNEEFETIKIFAKDAKNILERKDNQTFALGVLSIIPPGLKTSEPNLLEELIERVYPSTNQ